MWSLVREICLLLLLVLWIDKVALRRESSLTIHSVFGYHFFLLITDKTRDSKEWRKLQSPLTISVSELVVDNNERFLSSAIFLSLSDNKCMQVWIWTSAQTLASVRETLSWHGRREHILPSTLALSNLFCFHVLCVHAAGAGALCSRVII